MQLAETLGQSPNICWPADRASCAASEIDFDSTLVAGSEELITAQRPYQGQRERLNDTALETPAAAHTNGVPGPAHPPRSGHHLDTAPPARHRLRALQLPKTTAALPLEVPARSLSLP